MIKALAIKELRESAGLAALGALGMLYVVLLCMGKMFFAIVPVRVGPHIPFILDSFNVGSGVVVGFFAVLLGLKQTAWELNYSTFCFLLHRPLSRRMILAIKLTIGGLLIISLLAVAILSYGIWANTPGSVPAPFQWSMTAESWRLAQPLVLVYLGAFLSGIRPGRWFGTRLAPLAGAILVAVLVSNVTFWWLQLPLLAVAIACWLVAIDFFAHNRDY